MKDDDDFCRLNNPCAKMVSSINCNWDDPYGGSYGGKKGYSNYYDDSTKNKKKHKFSPVLLVWSTVFNCEHCGAKKEDCKSDFCESTDDYNIGDWDEHRRKVNEYKIED